MAGIAAGLLLYACGGSGPASPPDPEPAAVLPPRALAIAAASDLRYALDDMVAAFREGHAGIDVVVSYGSSGSFFAQLLNGAPFDLYLSADIAYASRLVDQGLALPDSLFTYAEGRLVVWVPSSSTIDIATRGLAALTDEAVARVAIANPEHAPYGRAAEAALKSAGVYEMVRPKLVLGENVSQALQFVESGAAQAGVVALSLALAPPVVSAGRYAVVPADAHPRLVQGGVIMRKARGMEAAQLFRSFMMSTGGRGVLDRYGFAVPR